MNNRLKKNRISRLTDNQLLIAFAVTFLSFVLWIVINRLCFSYATNDDYIISIMINKNDDKIIFLNYFLNVFICFLQNLIPQINMFMIIQIILCFISFVLINYVILNINSKFKLFFSILFSVSFAGVGSIYLQWTTTATVVFMGGLFLVFYSIFFEKKTCVKRFQMIFGLLFSIIGSLFRLSPVKIVLVFLVGFIVLFELSNMINNKGKSWKDDFLKIRLKKYLYTFVLCVVLYCLVFGSSALSNSVKSTSEYNAFLEYNNARASVNDYSVKPYEGNEIFYNSIDILSQDDLDMISNYHFDKDFFTTERLSSISHYSGSNGIASVIYKVVNNLNKILSNPIRVFIFGIALLLIIVLSIVVFKKRNRIKMLFPFILSGLWILFFLVFRLSESSIAMIPIAVIAVMSGFLYNRYHWIISFIVSLVVIMLFSYMYLLRLNFRVAFSFILPAFLFYVALFDDNNIRIGIHNKMLINPKKLRLCNTVCFCAVIALLVLLFFDVYSYKITPGSVDRKTIGYVENHKNEVFIYTYDIYRCLDKNVGYALLPPKIPDNTLVYGDWQVSSYYYKNELRKHGISKLFLETIDDNTKNLLIRKREDYFDNDKTCSEKEFISKLENYYNSHYSNDKTVKLFLKKDLGNVLVYNVKTETKD